MKAGVWPPLLLGAGLIAVWEIYVRAAGIDPLLLPPPSAVARYIAQNAGLLATNGASTLAELLIGFACGVVIGLSLGILMQVWRWFHDAAYPWLVATQMVPIPAVAPILVLWFGFTIVPKAATVALMCFFPIAVNTLDGLSSVDSELIRLLRTFGAGPWQVMSLAAFPAALPSIFSGVRVAMALSVIGAVVGEWVGSTHGLGYLMLHFENRGETAGLFATVTVLTIMGIILFFLVGWVEAWVIPWRRHAKETP
ncbi:MAG TPA: ABC transporter permease [Verrucomicrobiae bacterium]|jgi:ABC-type nitrate/sulfonate/bicarbonate transport system permease component|nr:ABC transporter permease [Verrucomicrobiae bacterium]